MTTVLLAMLLWVPGALLRRGFAFAPGPWGSGRLAVEAILSLAFACALLLPLYLAGAPTALAPPVLLLGILVLVVVVLSTRRRREGGNGILDGASAWEVAAFAVAAALLLPTTLAHSGANVDDWWDLSFVSGWLAEGRFRFEPMALSPEVASGATSPVHPRFLWSVWLMLQSVVAGLGGEAAWKVQGGELAAAAMLLVVSAQAALARALHRTTPATGAGASASAVAAATVAASVAWIWGSQALPLFVRGYQDKLVAAFVLAPVLVALVLDAVARPQAASDTQGERGAKRAALAVFAAAAATVSVHSLVFTMALVVSCAAVAAMQGRRCVDFVRSRHGIRVAIALVLPALYPLAQALALSMTFGEQGVSLATPDNPVVRAHLSLNRIVGATGPAWVVHPGAVFGPVALAALVAAAAAWRRRREAAARVLLAMSVVPCLLIFVPGLAFVAGKLWVPWMLYRLGWMVPVAPLLGYALATWRAGALAEGRRPLLACVLAVLVLALSAPVAADRLRRGMNEHPGQPPGAPIAAAAAVYEYLADRPGRDGVLAPPNFSELVPAISGKPVVAFPERGTLVFSGSDRAAYERLRDRATFFASSTPPLLRDEIARRYGARWAVLPRRLVASGSEAWWLRRFGPEALLAARAADSAAGVPCESGACSTWWSATREGLAAGLSPAWKVVLENRDYFVVEHSAGTAAGADVAPATSPMNRIVEVAASAEEGEGAGLRARWLASFDLTPPVSAPAVRSVLASLVEAPGATVHYAPPPRFFLPSVLPVWAEGPAGWEDAPAEAAITVDVGVACRVSAVEVVPHLPRERREVFELRIDDHVVRAEARHQVGILVPLDHAVARRSVTVHVGSLLGNPVSLTDVRLLGDSSTCEGFWPARRRPEAPGLVALEADLLDLAAAVPPGGRAFVTLARKAGVQRDRDEVLRLLAEAARKEPSLVEAWIDLGFAQDEMAADSSDPATAASFAAAALESFRSAVKADSRSAWARGCLAWARRRAGSTFLAMADAMLAAQLDPMYADAWTILAYSLGDLRLYALAERAVAVAADVDPTRNWPALARADLALARGDDEAAREALRAWIREHPYDALVRSRLAEIASASAAEAAGKGGAEP
ncbi:MAG: tetratricopeptide repeat protein [Candidatus Binatia bacterium]